MFIALQMYFKKNNAEMIIQSKLVVKFDTKC